MWGVEMGLENGHANVEASYNANMQQACIRQRLDARSYRVRWIAGMEDERLVAALEAGVARWGADGTSKPTVVLVVSSVCAVSRSFGHNGCSRTTSEIGP